MIRFYYTDLSKYALSTSLSHPLYHRAGLLLLERGLSDLGFRKKCAPDSASRKGGEGLSPAAKVPLALSFDAHGKPFLPNEPNLHFSISHAGAYVICALSDQNIGADILDFRQNRRIMLLAKRFFSPKNFQLLQKVAKEEVPSLFFQLFCATESYTKLTGDGLSHGMKDLYMDEALLHVYDKRSSYSPSGYLTRPLQLAEYACFLCTRLPLSEEICCIPVSFQKII